MNRPERRMKAPLVAMLVGSMAIYLSATGYIFMRALQALDLSLAWATLLALIFIVLCLLYPVQQWLSRRGIPLRLGGIAEWWLAFVYMLFPLLLLVDLLRLSDKFWPWLPAWAQSPQAGRYLTAAVVLIALLLLLLGRIQALHLRIVRAQAGLPGYPASAGRMRILFVSDLHLGMTHSRRWFRSLLAKLRSEQADLVVLGGDTLDGPPEMQREALRELGEACQGMKRYAILGNHEFYHGDKASADALTEAGFEMLRGESRLLDDALILVGIDDTVAAASMGAESLDAGEAAVEARGQHGEALPMVLLHHSPEDLDTAAAAGYALQLSGHTHGGQIWPLNYIARSSYGISEGWQQVGGHLQLCVSRGAGVWGPPIRLAAPPELLLLELGPAAEDAGSSGELPWPLA